MVDFQSIHKQFIDHINDIVNELDFEVTEEQKKKLLDDLSDIMTARAGFDERRAFEDAASLIVRRKQEWIDLNKEAIKKQRSKETVEQKLDKIEDHLIELIKILKDK